MMERVDENLGLELNLDALRAVAVSSVAMESTDAERIKEVIDRKLKSATPVCKLLIDASTRGKDNEDLLSIKLLRYDRYARPGDDHDGARYEDEKSIQRFPQKKYVERTNEYLVAVTPPNVEHLVATWREGEYQLTPAARMMLDIYFANQKAAGASLNMRSEFLANGVAPKLDEYYFVEGMPPYPHQSVGFAAARDAEYFALIMDPGTGKTRIVWDVICDRARRRRVAWLKENGADVKTADVNEAWQNEAGEWAPQFKVLVVAPKTVCRTWVREAEKWATLNVNVERLVGSKLQRAGLLATLLSDRETPILCAVINYDGLEVLEQYLKPGDDSQPWDLMICDESIAIKNSEAQRSKTVYRVASAAKSRMILNGTPISKNVLDLYGQYHFLKPGLLGYTTFYSFEQYFAEKNYFGSSIGYRKEKLPELLERMASNSYVIRRDQCVKLPDKIFATIEPEMVGDQRAAYEQMAEQMIVDLEKIQAGETIDTEEDKQYALKLMMGDYDESKVSMTQWVLVRMLRLAQVTSGFIVMKDGSLHKFKEQPKLDALEEHLDSLHDDQRIVVWSRWRQEIDMCVERFKDQYGAVGLYGGIKDGRGENCKCGICRECRLDAHEHGGTLWKLGNKVPTRLIVVQPQTGGFGLNELIGSTDVGYLSNEWSLAIRTQSEDRTHRIGVNLPVLYSDYVIPNTIDQIIYDRIQSKRELSELLTNPQNIVNALKTQLAGLRAR